MQKGPASTLIAVLALVALVLATIVPASATAAPSEVKASQPSTEMGQTAAGKVVDCDRPQSGRVAGAKITLYEEWVVWINNNTTIEKRPFTGNARVANSNGEWDVFLLKWNYSYVASHDDWTADARAWGRIDNSSFGKPGVIDAGEVCLNPKPLVNGKIQQQGTGAKLTGAQLIAFYEDKGVVLNNTRVSGGDFSFRAEPGTYTLKARYPCHYDASAMITVSPPSGAGIGTTVDAGILELAKIGDPCVRLFGAVKDSTTGQRIGGQANVTAFDDEAHFTSNVSTLDSAFYFLDLTRGSVKVVAKASGYFDTEIWVTIPKGVINQRQDIVMTPIGPSAFEISGWVKNAASAPVPGARVDLYDDRGNADATKKYSSFAISSATGSYKFMVPNVVNSSSSLIASKDGYLNNSPRVVASGADRMNENITLGNLPAATGLLGTIFARDVKGVPTPLAGARATLYDTMHLKSFTNVSSASGAVQFPSLYAGTFFLAVDHPSYQSNGTTVMLAGGPQGYAELVLEDHVRDLYNSSYIFARNVSVNSNLFNVSNYMLYRNVTLEHDNVSLRAGLDLSFGRGPYGYIMNDWNISAGEYQQWLAFRKPKWEGDAKSEDFFTVNKTSYDRKATSPISAVNNTGGVLLRAPMKFMVDMLFNTTKLKNGSLYDLTTNSTYDTFTTNYTGLVHVPVDYERRATNSPFDLQNHTRVIVDPPNGSGRAEVKFTFQSSGVPTPVAKIWAWNDGTHTAERGAYVKPNTDGKVFLVSNETKLILSGEDSKDNGAILKYKWDFNGTLNRTTDWISNQTSPHYYNETAGNLSLANNYTVLMWVLNRGLKTNETNISAIIDHLRPVAIANVTSDKDVHVNNGTGPANAWKIVWANESQSIGFNASFSYDNTTADKVSKDRNGTIRSYQWDWDDNITNKKNRTNFQDGSSLSHAFKVNGTYNVTLNVTDVVGHWTKVNLTVVVNDTTKPDVFVEAWELKSLGYTADKNLTDTKQGKENKTYSFRVGKNTKDPNFGTIVEWNWMVASPANKFYVNNSSKIDTPIQGKEWTQVPWLNHTFNATGVWTVSVNMTDAKDNWKNETFRITIAQQARPDLVFNTPTGDKEKLNFSVAADKIKAGTIVEIKANLSNNKGVGGAANATNVKVKLFIEGTDTGIFWEPTSKMMKAPEKAPVYENVSLKWDIPWTETAGVRKIKLVAETDGENGGEHPTAKEDSNVEKEINLQASDISVYGLWGGGTAAAIVIIGLYIAWRQKRGPFSEESRTLRKLKKEEKSREKDEEEEEEEKEKEKKSDKDKGAKKKDEEDEEE